MSTATVPPVAFWNNNKKKNQNKTKTNTKKIKTKDTGHTVRCQPAKLKGLGLPGLALSSASGNSWSGLVYSLLCCMECSEA